MSARAVALWCAVLVALGAAGGYTIDCNHEYTDCDTELSKIAVEDDEDLSIKRSTTPGDVNTITTTSLAPKRTTETQQDTTFRVTTEMSTSLPSTEAIEPTEPEIIDSDSPDRVKPNAHMRTLNVDELQKFANALHNQTDRFNAEKKKSLDLSDVTLDDDEEDHRAEHQKVPEKFFPSLNEPFPQMERNSEEETTCKENDVIFKVGEKMDRGCEESCECSPGGTFECVPRCKHPYIRRGRRLNDPLCFESPVDVCCSIIACTTGQGDPKLVQTCRYGNETHPVGSKWYIGCDQKCSCEANSVVTCQPRCQPLQSSDKCINVQDPADACCEIQVCDVSQDVHEIPENVTSTTQAPVMINPKELAAEIIEGRSNSGPSVLAEPIDSIKVLQNNSVQVNILNATNEPIHLLLSKDGGKSFKDVELKYSNLILNLEEGIEYILKTKETGTMFNFTLDLNKIVNPDVPEAGLEKQGCWEDGKFYNIGEEFNIGCSELCECTGHNERECAALACPNHVGLELMSKGCVRWAPSPPAHPPNCCPREARCLSDGTCYYNGVPVPNWTEVPLSLTGCEQRCFCENGDLDCQEVCTPLPSLPPQTMRCPPMFRPAPVNISDEDCCKQWGCLPVGDHDFTYKHMQEQVLGDNYVYISPPSISKTPFPPLTTQIPSPTPTDPFSTPIDFFKHFNLAYNVPSTIGYHSSTVNPIGPQNSAENYKPNNNITVFTLDDIESPFKVIQAEPPLLTQQDQWPLQAPDPKVSNVKSQNPPISHHKISQISHTHPEKHIILPFSNKEYMHDFYYQPKSTPRNVIDLKIPYHDTSAHYETSTKSFASFVEDGKTQKSLMPPPLQKVPLSSLENFQMFLPDNEKNYGRVSPYKHRVDTSPSAPIKISFFKHGALNETDFPTTTQNPLHNQNNLRNYYPAKQITVLNAKDLNRKHTTPAYALDKWGQSSTHVLTKQLNPYETVLLRAIQSTKGRVTSLTPKDPLNQKPSALSLEHLLSQMELETEVNRNLGRDTNKAVAIGSRSPDFPHKTQAPFIPTIQPGVAYPEEELPGYDQNNIHRPDDLPEVPPGATSFGDMNKKLAVISVESDSPNSVTMLLGLPSVLVGLRGSVDLRYTDTAEEDISHWYSQVFAPADEILTTPRLEFRLTGLKPSTFYKIRGKLVLHNLPVAPASDIYTVKTQDVMTQAVPEEKRKEISSRLTLVEVNDTNAQVSWRRFSEEELQYIDAIQVRFRPIGTPIYIMTELLHHSRSIAELNDLRPGTRYEASLVLVPPPRATVELNDPERIEFNTAPYNDPYNWTVTIDVRTVGSTAAELSWSGVPSPAERWVRVFRAAHACGDQPGKEQDEFKLASRDQPPSVMLVGLEPDSRCRVWLELFLSNGKVKTSNVLEINTKTADSEIPIDNEIAASSISSGHARGDYYSALVGVGVVAALGALTSLLLLLVVVRRHRPRSANITPVPSAPRESSLPPYDNPAFKLELQQETMDI